LTTVLVTGASGFIGRNLAEQLRCEYDVTAPSRAELDLCDDASTRQWFESRRFDVVLNCATVRSNRLLGEPPNLFADNCRMFFNLLHHGGRFGRLLHFGSGAQYDCRHYRPLMPEEYFDTYIPADGYGFAKYICSRALQQVENAAELRLFSVFGRYEAWQVRFISNACCRVIHGLPILMHRDLLFDFLYVDDLVRLVKRFIESPLRSRAYNVCTAAPVKLSRVARIVAEVSGRNPDIVVKEPGLGTEYSGNNARMLAEFGGFHFTPLTQSISKLYNWYEAHKPEIDPSQLRFDG